ncbi:exo-beta-N-acetylmuramidase NamZ family protein [Microscilla marina]|uniref:DUF1343 domain-containing protein n=1 Tax=Microscilla marina ATCC 23134 TaxID=313606 RepID=A1ZSJ4_MICM2|nr:DUF1343 domain-containing protein [Microscilla marina]EAY26574.1 conserved hypothetical protein [Microscilla marina ATCC 23134]
MYKTYLKALQLINTYKSSFCLLVFTLVTSNLTAQVTADSTSMTDSNKVQVGAAQMNKYIPLLKGKKIALVVNQTSVVGNTHLVDSLLALNLPIQKVFAPEHGFRGKADAGEHVKNSKDTKTNLPIISLYGKNKKPSPQQLADIDWVVFDIQDVGARFYTYISTMHLVMEACAENNKKVLVLDRPNPNGHYVAGPMLNPRLKSFVGMHPIPIVHGLTVGELAKMINQEKWLKGRRSCKLTIIKVKNYTHQTRYSLPVKPSPNLPNNLSIALYPSLCLFEGTQISVGRGTYSPFQMIGYPEKKFGKDTFTPKSIPGMSKYPKHKNKVCYGIDFRHKDNTGLIKGFSLKYLIDYYRKFGNKAKFFNGYFDTLVGNFSLQQKIKKGWTAEAIEKSWEKDLKKYKTLRRKYLLYAE